MSTAYLGKNFLLSYHDGSGWVEAGAARVNSLSINKETIDITNKTNGDWKTLLAGGIRSIEMSAEGVFTDGTGQAQVMDDLINATIARFKMSFGNSRVIDASFDITKFECAGENGKEQTFSFSLASSGEPTVT